MNCPKIPAGYGSNPNDCACGNCPEERVAWIQPLYTDCRNCGTTDHVEYECPCSCHGAWRVQQQMSDDLLARQAIAAKNPRNPKEAK